MNDETRPLWQAAYLSGVQIPRRQPDCAGVHLSGNETRRGRETVALAESVLVTLALELACEDGTDRCAHCRILAVAESCRAFGVTLAKGST